MPEPTTPRRIADDLVETMADLNPLVAVQLGIRPGDDTMPDFSPDHAEEVARVQRGTLAAIDAGKPAGWLPPEEARCASRGASGSSRSGTPTA